MERKSLLVQGKKIVIWGEPSETVYLCVHGQGGSSEEGRFLAEILRGKAQVVSFDLPEHGERKAESGFDPWHTRPELQAIMGYCREHWSEVDLYAISIGGFFSMLAFKGQLFPHCLMVSPILDLLHLTYRMMGWAGVDEAKLERERMIATNFGQTLSWEYLQYLKEHKVTEWNSTTHLLYGSTENLTERETIDSFLKTHQGDLTVMEGGEHWFHTPEELDFLKAWIERNCL